MKAYKKLSSAFLLASLISWAFGAFPSQAQGPAGPALPTVALCEDGRQIVGYGIIIENLRGSSTLRLTAVGADDFDPGFAIINPDGRIQCSQNTPGIEGTTVAIPGIGRIEANAFTAQRSVTVPNTNQLQLVLGGYPGQSGTVALLVENLQLSNRDEVDIIRVKIPPAAQNEWVNGFMVGVAENLDPAMALLVGDSLRPARECDNAGTRTCVGVPTLVGRGAIINTDDTYPGDEFDAGVMGAFSDDDLAFQFRDSTGLQTGEYMAVITGTAPGAVLDDSFICENVITGIGDSSPAYNPTYQTEDILDGDPLSFWVTGASARDATTGQRTGVSFIVLQVDPTRLINKIRINGFAQASLEFAPNALKNFAVRLQNTEDDVVTAVEAELLQQPGYQTYSFLPAQVSEIGLILLDNYGGTLFTLVDVQVCALP
jgi:hypothetical protein